MLSAENIFENIFIKKCYIFFKTQEILELWGKEK